jgi:hypothetical protein
MLNGKLLECGMNVLQYQVICMANVQNVVIGNTIRDLKLRSKMMTQLTVDEVIEQFAKYVKEKKITVYAEFEPNNTLHIFKTPENAPWLKHDRKT